MAMRYIYQTKLLRYALYPLSALALAWAAPAAAQQPGDGIEEVIVTAQRRSEDIQKSSLAITALTGENLAKSGVTQIQDLSNMLPGVNISLEGAQTQVYVRGVGTFAANSLADPAVAVYVDQGNIARPSGLNALFYDVSRVEVLKGPQGTLYGRNASGGAINIVTNNPSFSRLSADGSITGGNYNTMKVEGAVNVPVNDMLAVRGAFQVSKHDGYLSDGTNDENQSAVRIKALLRASDNFSLLLSGDYGDISGKGTGGADYPAIDSGNPWIGQADPRSNAIKVAGTAQFLISGLHLPSGLAATLAPQAANAANDYINYHPWGVSADAEWDLGSATLSILPFYRTNDGSYLTHSGTFYFYNKEKESNSSVEVRLGNTTPTLTWTIGGYYSKEHIEYDSLADTNPVSTTFSHVPLLDDKNWAAFGQATYAIFDGLRVIGGLRHTQESKDFNGTGYATSGAGAPVPRAFAGGKSWNSTNWKGGLEYDIAPQSMAYFTISTGFKAGGFGTAGSVVIPYDPEKLKAYELGIKNRFFNNTLQVNAEAFYWDYVDHQEPHLGPSPAGGGAAFYTTNAGKASIKGVDLSVVYDATAEDIAKFDVEYNHSRYDVFTYDENVGFANALNTGCGIGAAHNIQVGAISVPVNTIDCAGFQLTKAPEWSGTLSYEHIFNLAGGATVSAAVSSRYSSAIWGAVDFIPNERFPSFTQTNLNLTYTPANRKLSVMVFARNLEKKAVYTNAFQAQFVPGLVAASILAPRTYGVTVAAHF